MQPRIGVGVALTEALDNASIAYIIMTDLLIRCSPT